MEDKVCHFPNSGYWKFHKNASFFTLKKDAKGNAVAKTVEKDTLNSVSLEKSVEEKFHVSTDTTMNQKRAI